jgi:hypothetical protein
VRSVFVLNYVMIMMVIMILQNKKNKMYIYPEKDCDQTAMDLPLVMSAIFLIGNFGKTWASRRSL